MHKIFPLLLIIAISSCNSEDDNVRMFEKVLGKQQTHYLDEVVSGFDDFLKNEFHGSFKEYLITVANSKPVGIWSIDSPHIKQIKESNHFCVALHSVKQSDSLILTYLNAKEAIGDISPASLANGLLHHYNENNVYFAKRIFVIEILGWDCC